MRVFVFVVDKLEFVTRLQIVKTKRRRSILIFIAFLITFSWKLNQKIHRRSTPSSRRECGLASERQNETSDDVVDGVNRKNVKNHDDDDDDDVEAEPHDSNHSEPSWRLQRDRVKEMTLRAWRGYASHAWGANELSPASESGRGGVFSGADRLGLTIIDSLSTLKIMGLDEEFRTARNWVAESFDPFVDASVSVFELNIRILGGLLSAFALTSEDVFRQKAELVGKSLLKAFRWPSGLPSGTVNLKSGAINWLYDFWQPASIASVGSLHLEFVYLSHVTGDDTYAEKVRRIRHLLDSKRKLEKNLFPKFVYRFSGDWASNEVTLGPQGDSFFEYLVKSWLQSNRTDYLAKRMFDEALEGVAEKLLQRSSRNRYLYLAERKNFENVPTMHHLACFAGGMFMLGADGDSCWRRIGEDLASTCRASYVNARVGIGPDRFYFSNPSSEASTGYSDDDNDRKSYLRPEAVETWFYLWRFTKDVKYRRWAMDFLDAIENHSAIGAGFSAIKDVYSSSSAGSRRNKLDEQPSFFLAETLKYLFLIFDDDDRRLPLDQWVFNTEAHPLPVLGGG